MNLDIRMRRRRNMYRFIKKDRARSPLIVTILKQNKGILEKIVKRKKEWIHVKDDIGRNALHYAASIGYLHGVDYLLQNCHTCNMERDNNGFFPLHLASTFGHIEVLKKLLENCPNPREIVDNKGRNIVHIAAIMGQFNVVRYVLRDANDGVKDMINDKDYDGNTPLHLAASHSRPKIVQALTWDTRVDLHCLNNNNQTALDAFEQFKQENNPPYPQRLTWCQLKSVGVQNAKRGLHSIEIPSPWKPEPENTDFYKDRINTLMVVSTLITTVAFAGGFTLPGGNNSCTPGQGMAVMLNHMWFKPFIFCITASMYGGISVTIILIWAQLGDITLTLLALNVAMPLLGVTLATLSMAFLAGVHLVISDLSWLATTVLILCVVFILLLLLLYTLLWFPSKSSNLIMRYIYFYPFRFLTWLFEDSIEGRQFWIHY
ncbi:protein ACCELERATED CELL DEATH 6-like [Phaseolus vulgaris]|uniref:protein ACCELERATED CELL DEATH 6-like n=1 Tax=Phaseolus vulgaris TaxID=3885 RepID=UPI0035C97F66